MKKITKKKLKEDLEIFFNTKKIVSTDLPSFQHYIWEEEGKEYECFKIGTIYTNRVGLKVINDTIKKELINKSYEL